jgi:hypothetical protein
MSVAVAGSRPPWFSVAVLIVVALAVIWCVGR